MAYMLSDQWKWVNQRVRQAGVRCLACQSRARLQLHHVYYTRLGREQWFDLIPLCRSCHKRLHDVLGALPARCTAKVWEMAFGNDYHQTLEQAKWEKQFRSLFPTGMAIVRYPPRRQKRRPAKKGAKKLRRIRSQMATDRAIHEKMCDT
jgi:hypothetical protein